MNIEGSRTDHIALSGFAGAYCYRGTLLFRGFKHGRRILDGARRLSCDGTWHHRENVGAIVSHPPLKSSSDSETVELRLKAKK